MIIMDEQNEEGKVTKKMKNTQITRSPETALKVTEKKEKEKGRVEEVTEEVVEEGSNSVKATGLRTATVTLSTDNMNDDNDNGGLLCCANSFCSHDNGVKIIVGVNRTSTCDECEGKAHADCTSKYSNPTLESQNCAGLGSNYTL